MFQAEGTAHAKVLTLPGVRTWQVLVLERRSVGLKVRWTVG